MKIENLKWVIVGGSVFFGSLWLSAWGVHISHINDGLGWIETPCWISGLVGCIAGLLIALFKPMNDL